MMDRIDNHNNIQQNERTNASEFLFFQISAVGCVLMSPKISEKPMVTAPSSYLSDVEMKPQKSQSHRRRQKLCTTQRLPATFAWFLLLSTSFAYWICIFPEILILLPQLLPIPIVHCVLFVFVCVNFVLATFMDPVSMKTKVSPKKNSHFFRVSINNQ